MIDINNMTDRSVLADNYKTIDNLSLRKNFHEKYSVNKIGFQRWMFDQYCFGKNKRILELGSGKGELWDPYFENPELMGMNMEIVLSDLSDGMVEYLDKEYMNKGIIVKKIDVSDIPYEDGYFDIIIANSMLYHLADIDKALREIRRVLKKGGVFYCSTFGINGMTKFLYDALSELSIPFTNKTNISFTLQNGEEQLKNVFDEVERRDYIDGLRVDKVEDYVDYIFSMSSLKGLEQSNYEILLDYFNEKKKEGYLIIPKEYGIFISR